MLAFDDFPGANGALIGRSAEIGGIWETSATPYSPPSVTSNQVLGEVGDTAGAALPAVITDPQLQEDWWMAFTMVPTAREVTSKSVGMWLGDEAGHFCGLIVSWDNTTAGPGQVAVIGGNLDGTPVNVDVSIGSFAAEVEFVLQFLAADLSWHVYVDDVEVGSVAGVGPLTPNDLALVIYLNCGAVAAVPRMTEIELSTGVYAF